MAAQASPMTRLSHPDVSRDLRSSSAMSVSLQMRVCNTVPCGGSRHAGSVGGGSAARLAREKELSSGEGRCNHLVEARARSRREHAALGRARHRHGVDFEAQSSAPLAMRRADRVQRSCPPVQSAQQWTRAYQCALCGATSWRKSSSHEVPLGGRCASDERGRRARARS